MTGKNFTGNPLRLPTTSPEHYLTGKTALNIPSPAGTGDWHFAETFEGFADRDPGPFTVAGIHTIDTNAIFGNAGVFDCGERLRARGLELAPGAIYAADHYRAIVDMVLNALARGWEWEGAITLDDWLPEKLEKQRFFDLLERARSVLSTEHWQKITAWSAAQLS